MATQRDLSLADSPASRCRCWRSPKNRGSRLRLHDQGKLRRGDHQWHRDPRPRQSWRARGQAGDGRQGGAVQALRRYRFHRSRGLDRGPGGIHQLRPAPGQEWGGINLEDIKAPECFIIEQKLRELLDIPVFHDDQHGTAIIIAAAGLSTRSISPDARSPPRGSSAMAPAPRASPASSSCARSASAGEPRAVRHQGGDRRGPLRTA